MPVYICSECGKRFEDKTKYNIHINRKFPCKKDEISSYIETNIDSVKDVGITSKMTHSTSQITQNFGEITQNNSEINLMCQYCSKIYSRRDNLFRHIKSYCKVKKQEDNNKKEIYNKLLKELDEIKKENEELKKINNKLISSNNNIHIKNQNIETQNNIVNINLIAHGREDLDKIDVKYIIEALKRGISCIPVITERIHFNEKYPEYQNVYISNMNQKYGMIYNGKEWKLKDKDTIIEDLYEKKFDFLDENFENIYNQLSESQQKAFKRFLDIHEKADTDKQSRKIINKIKQDLKLMLYNNKNIPMDTYNKITMNNG